MKNFFKEIKNSIYGPNFYRELLEKPFSYSVKYFFKLILLIAFIYSVIFSATALPALNHFLKKSGPIISQSFPDNLEIRVEKGLVSINQESPFFYETPDFLKKQDGFGFKNLVTIDTREKINLDEIKQYDSLFLITKNEFIYQEEGGKITAQTLDKLHDIFIDKTVTEKFFQKISDYLKFIFPLLTLFVFLFSYFLIASFNILYLTLGSLFIWLVAYIKNFRLGYVKSYQFGLHLLTFPLVIFALPLTTFPLAFTFILVVLAAVNLEEKEASETQNTPPSIEDKPKK